MPDYPQSPPSNPGLANEDAPDQKRKPAIRTMRMDLAEVAKSPGVSVTQTISEELKTHPPQVTFKPPRSKRPLFILGGTAVLLLIIGVSGYLYISTEPSKKVVEAPNPPAPLFGTERSTTFTVRSRERLGFLRQVETEVKDLKRKGTITRIFLKIIDGPQERFASLRDFAELMGFDAPSGFSQQFGADLMLFVYQGSEQNHFGVAARVKEADRAFREMFIWEKTLPGDFFPLLFDSNVNTIGASFEDKTYRNIDYRFAKLSPDKDLGVGYTVFPARKVLVITTGQEATERIIDRLFDAK